MMMWHLLPDQHASHSGNLASDNLPAASKGKEGPTTPESLIPSTAAVMHAVRTAQGVGSPEPPPPPPQPPPPHPPPPPPQPPHSSLRPLPAAHSASQLCSYYVITGDLNSVVGKTVCPCALHVSIPSPSTAFPAAPPQLGSLCPLPAAHNVSQLRSIQSIYSFS